MDLHPGKGLDILRQSPHDLRPPEYVESSEDCQASWWLPSRYNVRAVSDDGRLVIWNTRRRAISVFGSEQRPAVERLLTKKGFEALPEGIVGYLSDRGFLVTKGVDERRQLQMAIGTQHYRTDVMRLVLLPSEDCNFRCSYCYESFRRGTMLPWVRSGIKRYIEARAPKLNRLIISWFGGEPLYGLAAIKDLAPFFHEMAEEHAFGYFSDMTTNGYLLTPDVADSLLSWGIRSYQITLDGPPEDHNRSRPARDGSPTFSTILANLVAMSRREDEFSVTLRMNFSMDNRPGMSRFLDIVEDALQADPRFQLRFHPVDRWGGVNDSQLKTFERKEAMRIRNELMADACTRGLAIRDDLRASNRLGARVCAAARPGNFIIGADGKVMKCTLVLDKEDFNVLGRIDEEGDLHLDADKAALWSAPTFEESAKCQKCLFLPNCQGLACPLAMIRGGKHACISTRANPKGELLAVLKSNPDRKKVVTVAAHAAAQ